ncbi:MAG: PQQ-binding-like beta-propeller repeat protein [Candidatus Bathyarchaeota archaeon]|jgi:outer membrane protein assembly factor BamB|nr:PQQ-binding-like beta-propeller repeat protein [Candidatus Bathyarchaeota archaeon]
MKNLHKKVFAIIAVVIVVLLSLTVLATYLVLDDDSTSLVGADNLLQYEWPQIHGDPGFTRFSKGPAPEVPDILWKTNITGIQSYLAAFSGKVFVTTATEVIALDYETGFIIWRQSVPERERWPAVYKIDDSRMVMGKNCLDIETGEVVWVSNDFSASVAYWAEGVYSPEEKKFYGMVDSFLQAWDFSDPSKPPELEWETFVQGGGSSGSGVQYGDGKVFPGSFDNHQVAIDAKTGEVLWNTQTKGSMIFSGSYYEGKFFRAGEHDNTFYCFNAENGDILWEFNPGTQFGYWVSGCAVAYDMVYELNKDGNLYALDVHTGEVVWKYAGADYLFWPGWPVVADGKVYATTGQVASSDPITGEYGYSEFACLDAYSGKVVWSLPIEAYPPRESVSIAYGNLYLIPGFIEENTMNSYVTLDQVWAIGTQDWPMWRANPANTANAQSGPESLNLNWDFTTEGAVVSSPSVVDGRVYVGSQDQNIYCLEARGGYLVWKFDVGSPIKSSPAVVDGKVFSGSDGGYVYCLNATSGKLIWQKDVGGYIEAHFDSVATLMSSPTVLMGKVFVGSLDTNLYCLNANNGDYLWTFKTQGYITSSPAVANGAVYITSQEPKSAALYKLNAESGDLIWKLETPYKMKQERGTDIHSSAVVDGGMVFIASNKDEYYGVNVSTGLVEWTYRTIEQAESGFLVASVASHEGRVFLVDQFFISCIDADNGDTFWKSWLGGEIYVSPTYADGKIYVAYDRRGVFVLDAADGKKLSFFEVDSNCRSSPIVYDRRVYIGNNDWKIYCLS